MTRAIVITGTDTDIGKTVFAAGLAGALDGYYWKPVQAGVEPSGDRETVASLSGLPAGRFLPEAYRLNTPASPHLAARIDGVEIDPERLTIPSCPGPLVIEGAGGVLVPLSENITYRDIFRRWQAPVILCARTSLGTINHSLLSIEALRAAGCNLLGIVFIGDEHVENEHIIPMMGNIPSLGRLPMLAPLTPATLRSALVDKISLNMIRDALA